MMVAGSHRRTPAQFQTTWNLRRKNDTLARANIRRQISNGAESHVYGEAAPPPGLQAKWMGNTKRAAKTDRGRRLLLNSMYVTGHVDTVGLVTGSQFSPWAPIFGLDLPPKGRFTFAGMN
jgi:hypothetical protein